MADRVHPDIRRALGAAEAHTANAERLLDEAESKPKRSISPSSGFAAIDARIEEETTETQRQIADLKQVVIENARMPQQSQPELSVRAPFNMSLRLAGAPAWVIALALVVVLALVIAIVLTRK